MTSVGLLIIYTRYHVNECHTTSVYVTFPSHVHSSKHVMYYTFVDAKYAYYFLCYLIAFYAPFLYMCTLCNGMVRSHRNNPYENSGKFRHFFEKTRRTEFPGISGNIFQGFPGIPEIPGNFSGNLGGFSRTRAVEQCTRR